MGGTFLLTGVFHCGITLTMETRIENIGEYADDLLEQGHTISEIHEITSTINYVIDEDDDINY